LPFPYGFPFFFEGKKPPIVGDPITVKIPSQKIAIKIPSRELTAEIKAV